MKKSVIICLFVVLVLGGGYLGLKFYLNKDLEKQKESLNNTILKYGSVEKETVEISVAKFNTQVMKANIISPASDEYMMTDNNLYWYSLLDGIYLYVKPENYSGNKKDDITKIMTIHYSKNDGVALNYVKALIKANNDKLTDSDIDYLMNEAKTLSNAKKNANNGKGISVSYVKNGEVTEYQVIRLYK